MRHLSSPVLELNQNYDTWTPDPRNGSNFPSPSFNPTTMVQSSPKTYPYFAISPVIHGTLGCPPESPQTQRYRTSHTYTMPFINQLPSHLIKGGPLGSALAKGGVNLARTPKTMDSHQPSREILRLQSRPSWMTY